ncbi:hypothetical protein LguiA_002829 [Lonicera macranthoides]
MRELRRKRKKRKPSRDGKNNRGFGYLRVFTRTGPFWVVTFGSGSGTGRE